eukprot:COSAG03_NODE_12715_length_534_cov_2.075862_2_plen_44_part_01
MEELRVLETQATVSFYTMQNLFGGERLSLSLSLSPSLPPSLPPS